MAELVTTATIRAHDALTGPLSAMASKVRSINQGLQNSGRAVAASTVAGAQNVRRGVMGAAVGGFGLGLLIDKAEEFNKHIFGIGAASLVDTMKSAEMIKKGEKFDPKTPGIDDIDVNKSLETMKEMQDLSMSMSRSMGFSATKIAEMGEVFSKAGMKEGLEDVMKATVTLSKADTDTPAKNIADFMHTLTVIQRPQSGEGYGAFIRRQADMVLTAADQTKLSVGSIMEGMRQFQTVGAGLGMKTEDMLGMMMIGAQAGFGASEFGTAMKSDLTRLLKPTIEGKQALSRLGINLLDPEISKGATALVGENLAIRNLNASLGVYGGIKPKESAYIKRLMAIEGRKGEDADKAGLVNRVTDFLARSKGIAVGKDREKLQREVEASVLTKTGDLNPIALWKKMIAAGATDTDFATVFEGRQLARNKALQKGISDGTYDQYLQLLQRMNGQGLDALETLWSKSIYGNVQAMKASFERLFIVLSNTGVVQSFVNHIERFMDAIGKMNPQTANLVAGAALLGAAMGPLALILRGLLSPLGLVAGGVMAIATASGDAQGSLHALAGTFKNDMFDFMHGSEWAQLQDSMKGVGDAVLRLFGKDVTDQTNTALELVKGSAHLAAGALETLAASINGLYDIAASMRLVAKRKDKVNLDTGMPDYMQWDDNIQGYKDTRGALRRFMDYSTKLREQDQAGFDALPPDQKYPLNRDNFPWMGKIIDYWPRLSNGPFTLNPDGGGNAEAGRFAAPGLAGSGEALTGAAEQLKASATEGASTQQNAASALTGAAGELSAAAAKLQNIQVNVNAVSDKGGAQAPPVSTTNGQSYGGR